MKEDYFKEIELNFKRYKWFIAYYKYFFIFLVGFYKNKNRL